MPCITYLLYGPSKDRNYVGQSEDPLLRLTQDHNGGRNKSTKSGAPWEHRWVKWFDTRAKAMDTERIIKARKSRRFIEQLISAG